MFVGMVRTVPRPKKSEKIDSFCLIATDIETDKAFTIVHSETICQ